MQDAIDILKDDHDRVKELLSELEETSNRATTQRSNLLAEIAEELTVHMEIEEKVFYLAFKSAAEKSEERVMYFEAQEEHNVLEFELPRLQKTDPSTDDFAAHAKVLKELVEHHVKEEEKEMFPAAKKLMSSEELEMLGEKMQAKKEKMMAKTE
jgi:hemerythrin-like domain-containing protein